MAKYPGASYRPLASKQGEPAIKEHDIVCLHTMVGYLTSTDAMFKAGGWSGTESHFGVGGKWGGDAAKGYDGKVFQWQDTAYSADANLEGNPRILSIETADNAPKFAKDIAAWTPKQLDAIVKLVTWLCKKYDIPPVLIPDSKPSRRGIGYHRQGCTHSLGAGKVPGYRVVGGERWSLSTGKECPGARRIAQIKSIIVPRVKTAVNGKPPPKPIQKPIPKPEVPVAANPLDEWKLKLSTQFQVDTMNAGGPAVPYKIGDTLDLRRLFMWGGPKDERMLAELRAVADDFEKSTQERDAQLDRIEDALAILAATSAPPTETGDPHAV